MNRRKTIPRPRWLQLLVLCLVPACTREVRREPIEARAAPPVRAWTQAFQHEAALVADQITIEGPADLLTHIAIQQDPEAIEYTTRTVAEGLFQELRSRPEFRVEIRAQLDAWSIAALQRMTVLQRPGDAPVIVRATGNVVWMAGDGSGERREQTLVFEGRPGR